ncbi:MAG: MFS transporter [Candidatus Bathyarchaeia archaeon]
MKVRKVFYGWMIVVVSFLSMAFWMGIRSSFSVFYASLLDDLRWTRADLAFAQSLTFVMYMVTVPFIGGFIDRFGPKKVIIPGVVLTSTGLVLCSITKSLFGMYVSYGVLVGIGAPFISIVAYSSILAHWFEKKRGLASGIATSGMGIGTFFLVILSQALIECYGWRSAFFILGLLTLCVLIPANGVFLKHRPEEMGLFPDGLVERHSQRTKGLGEQSLIKVLKSREFLMCVGFASLALLAVHIILVHNVRIFMDKGISMEKAASSLAMVGLVSSGFRVFWGWFSDKKGREMSYTLGAIFLVLSAVFLFITTAEREWLIYMFVLTFSAGWAVTAPSFMALLADLFKGKQFGAIYGFFESLIYGLSVVGVWVVGFIYDVTGTYWPTTFVIIAASVILSVLIVWSIRPEKEHR